MQSKAIISTLSCIQILLFAAAAYFSFSLNGASTEIEKNRDIQLHANSLIRQVLGAAVASGSLATSGSDSTSSSGKYDEVLNRTQSELDSLAKLVEGNAKQTESIGKLRELIEKTNKIIKFMQAKFADGGSGMSEMLVAMKAVKGLYTLIDKISVEIDTIVSVSQENQAGVEKQRDMIKSLLPILLIAGALSAMGCLAMSATSKNS